MNKDIILQLHVVCPETNQCKTLVRGSELVRVPHKGDRVSFENGRALTVDTPVHQADTGNVIVRLEDMTDHGYPSEVECLMREGWMEKDLAGSSNF